MKLLTNLIFEPKGKHDPALAYNIKDTVMSADGSRVYFALQDVPAGTALSNGEYWKLQIDLSSSKSAMDQALASFGNYAKEIGTRVRGETAEASGNPVTFLPDAGSLLQPVTVLDVQQQGSGDPSPENIRPITGYDAVELVRCGKNLFPYPFSYDSGFSNNGVTMTVNSDRTVTLSGTATADAYIFLLQKKHLPVGNYYLSGTPVGGGNATYSLTIRGYDKSGAQCLYNIDMGSGCLFEITEEFDYVEVYIRISKDFDAAGLVFKPMIRIASDTDGLYEPYQGDTYAINFGQTVYGGRFDWTTGVLTVTWAAIDGGSRNWSVYEDSGVTVFLTDGDPLKIYGAFNVISSHYKTSKNALVSHMGNMEIKGSNSSNAIFVRDTRYTDPAAFKAAMNGVQICYMLATPVEIGPFTPHIISAADPEQTNTLYGDGRIDVEYVKPLHVSIEEHGSEGEYELVETIVCDGTYGNLKRTGLALSHAKIYFHMQATEAAANVVIESNNDAGLFGYAVIGNAINTGERWSNVYLVSDGKNAYCEYVNAATHINSAMSVSKTASRKDASTPINRISIYAGGNKMFPAGSTIEIWGVRANA